MSSLSVLVLAQFVALFAAAPEKTAEPELLKPGEEAPAFSMKTSNPDLSKVKIFSLGRFVGAGAEEPKPAVVLSFAASYCGPCLRELPELRALEPRLAKAGIVLAVVTVDTEPTGIEAMRKLTVDELKLPYPVLSDRFGVLARRYRATQLPLTVVIDKGGTVQWVSAGFQPGSIEKLAAKLGI